ncbi:MAG: hypothetical protein CM15mP74_29780 [Halieaceae bacterium]|nr:MAG: hypothetical protein CM15mP74_29780 [Halieaceae bacterium]
MLSEWRLRSPEVWFLSPRSRWHYRSADGHYQRPDHQSLGRRRPYLLAGGVLAALSVIGLFSVHTVTFAPTQIWILVMLLVAATAYTVFNVPYMSMPAEMVQDPYERSKLMSFRSPGSRWGPLSGLHLPREWWLMHATPWGARDRGIFHDVADYRGDYSDRFYRLFHCNADAAATERTRLRVPFKEQARSALSNRPFLILLGIKYLGLYALSATVATNIFLFVR